MILLILYIICSYFFFFSFFCVSYMKSRQWFYLFDLLHSVISFFLPHRNISEIFYLFIYHRQNKICFYINIYLFFLFFQFIYLLFFSFNINFLYNLIFSYLYINLFYINEMIILFSSFHWIIKNKKKKKFHFLIFLNTF